MNMLAFDRAARYRGPIINLMEHDPSSPHDQKLNEVGGGWFEAAFSDGSIKNMFGCQIEVIPSHRILAVVAA
ncbi:hypothetical protein GS982_01160 [Rhodococcus hoagii]|uniref:Uncharacterized protein n=1 Tax=Rhodococcus hoagii TaxID=43767 RepID=A0A9Q4ZII8_RHOHA|nr:hypothetical protein [Prescottella equi]NKT77216.1 hypothetical protein [Prescottella equi]NKZ81000.1 hypothetical protein [Prescottella equi]